MAAQTACHKWIPPATVTQGVKGDPFVDGVTRLSAVPICSFGMGSIGREGDGFAGHGGDR